MGGDTTHHTTHCTGWGGREEGWVVGRLPAREWEHGTQTRKEDEQLKLQLKRSSVVCYDGRVLHVGYKS